MSALPKRIGAWLRSRHVELSLGVRVTAASLAALVVALALHLKLPLWAVLTSVIVTQMSVGRSLKTTRDYLVGTLGGALYGGAIAILVPHDGEGALLLVLIVAVAPLAFIAALNPAYNAATVTSIIVLLLPTMNQSNPLDSAIDRVLEVAVGAVTGLTVSFLVLPSRAHGQIRAGAARALELLAAALDKILAGTTLGHDAASLHRFQDGIGAALNTLTVVGSEAERELSAGLARGPQTGPLLRTILRLRHDLVIIGRASVAPLPDRMKASLAPPLAGAGTAIAAYLRESAVSLQRRERAPALSRVHIALEDYGNAVAQLRQNGLTRELSGEAIERVFALGFSLEQMRQNLADLKRCVDEWAGLTSLGQGDDQQIH